MNILDNLFIFQITQLQSLFRINKKPIEKARQNKPFIFPDENQNHSFR